MTNMQEKCDICGDGATIFVYDTVRHLPTTPNGFYSYSLVGGRRSGCAIHPPIEPITYLGDESSVQQYIEAERELKPRFDVQVIGFTNG